jgi:hypothetical protein
LIGPGEISSLSCNIEVTCDTSFLIVGSGFRSFLGSSKSRWSVQELRVTSIDLGVIESSQSHQALDSCRDI